MLGLALVVITTIFAAFLPSPEASAEGSVTSVTDTISVRVVGNVPDILNIKPVSGSVFIYPDQDLSFDYENVEYLTVTIYYTVFYFAVKWRFFKFLFYIRFHWNK